MKINNAFYSQVLIPFVFLLNYCFRKTFNISFRLADFGQNTRSSTSQAEAAAYVELKVPDDNGASVFGAGVDTSITQAPIRALISAINRI